MVKILFEKIVKADRKKVFGVAANYESYQKTLPEYFLFIHVRSIRGNVAVVEEHLKLAGRELVMMTKHIVQFPETHEVFVIGGDAKGSLLLKNIKAYLKEQKLSLMLTLN